MTQNEFSKRYEKLPVRIFDDSLSASLLVAGAVIEHINNNDKEGIPTVIAFSSSSAMIQVYEEIVKGYREKRVCFKRVKAFIMDEYYPISKDDLQSHYRFMREYLFDHIDIPQESIHFPDGMLHRDLVVQFCFDYEKKIKQFGGIDILLTSGMGFNEPGSPYNSHTRLITLNHSSRVSAASEFFGVEYVPHYAITMGIDTIFSAKKIFYLSWGEGRAFGIQKMIEGVVDESNPPSYLQKHTSIQVMVDRAAAAELTRIKTPWLTGSCVWDDRLIRRAVFWLCKKLDKPILKITSRDYNDNGMSDLVTEKGPASKINIKVFNDLQHTITGWPGGKPNADDSTRPERATPFPKRAVIFSPHPDDDVISMGGTLARLSEQGHEVYVAYQVSGNIAVFDHDAIRFLDFLRDSSHIYPISSDIAEDAYQQAVRDLANKKPGEADTSSIRQVKTAIRRGEAKSACRYLRIPEDRVYFLEMPFYETGGVKKKPIGPEDIGIVKKLLQKVQPHQIFAAGDLSDPHGTHRVCFLAIIEALRELENEEWLKNCRIWLYRGAWQEWDVSEADMSVPLSPEEVEIKREAIFKHQSQKDRPLFPGSDSREFWKRAEERNHHTADIYNQLGMAEYQAIELFVRYNLDD
ncbi:MAG: PIG-L family deacetylase [Prevotellaceae bacterium]|jgi:glucosamine-6-phosphate deaminase|nr:PIG-L family deacetylase [Prevotellaceae bacterium]